MIINFKLHLFIDFFQCNRKAVTVEHRKINIGIIHTDGTAHRTRNGHRIQKVIDFFFQLLPDKSRDYRLLDVSILHSLVRERLLGIDKENMASQKNLTYTRSAEEAQRSVDQGESQCCFLLNPTRVEEIGQVAQNGEKMPQKSTYFYPKLITGLVVNSLED